MADPFEQFKESDAAIEQARQAVEAQEAAEAAAAEAARIAAQEEAARRAAEQAEQIIANDIIKRAFPGMFRMSKNGCQRSEQGRVLISRIQ